MTADDLVFTMMVMRDKDLPIFGDKTYDSIDTVEAIDPRTVLTPMCLTAKFTCA